MANTFLQRLELAFDEASALVNRSEQHAYLKQLAEREPDIEHELRMLLELRHEAEDYFEAPQSEYASLLSTTLGDMKRGETLNDFLAFLSQVSRSSSGEEIANSRGFSFHELVSTGPTGFLFKGWDSQLRRVVAIKVLALSIAREAERKKLFIEEARLASSVRHPNVVPVYHISSEPDSDLVFYVMEWIDGITLQHWLEQHANRSFDRAESLAQIEQLSQGLDAIHARGIVHRDLKPANVLLESRSNHLKIVDFGIAFELAQKLESNLPTGTPLYMSPEQLRCAHVTPRSDLFALAEMTCLLVYGTHPFAEKTIDRLTARVLRGDPELPTHREGCNPATQAVLRKALSVEPEARFANAGDFCSAFQASFATLPVQIVPSRGSNATEELESKHRQHDSDPLLVALPSRRIFISPKAWLVMGCGLLLAALAAGGLRGIDFSGGKEGTNQRLREKPFSEMTSRYPPGTWSGNEFDHALGIRFRLLPVVRELIEQWPPDPNHPRLFENLGWMNREVPVLIGERLVTVQQYREVMGGDAIDPTLLPDQPITNVSIANVNEFCRRLTQGDREGLVYVPCGRNAWTMAAYGFQMLDGKQDVGSILLTLKNLSQGNDILDQPASTRPLIDDIGGPYWEWTLNKYTKPVVQEGIVSYQQRPEVPAEDIRELVSGGTTPMVIHFHDLNYGMNDHFHDSENLQLHVEADGDTCYLMPENPGNRAWLSYRYRFGSPVVSASIQAPFQLYQVGSSGGIRARVRLPSTPEELDVVEWQNIVTYKGPHFFDPGAEVDLSSVLKGAIEVEVQYWLEGRSEPAWETQLGRTSNGFGLPHVFGFEAVLDTEESWYRSTLAAPSRYRSPQLGFRIEAHNLSQPATPRPGG